jgi:GNAT superfamily N-acetyltransferase
MKIRRMTEHDVAAISKIIRDLGIFAYLKEESERDTEQRITHHFALCAQDDSHTVYVAENSGGKVIGYVSIHWIPYFILQAPDGYVSELFVAASERGKGVGSKLLAVAKEQAQERGCSRLSLLNLRNRESYQRGFYKKQGWTEREHVANFVFEL